jgi:predicted phosphodiesterase
VRVALISDIHGNSVALDAVFDDVRTRGGVDRWWVLGDIVALGPDPVGVLERLVALDDVAFLSGNTERYVVEGDRPYPQFSDVEHDPSLLPRFADVAASFAWTRGMVTQAGWFEWLRDLPATLRLALPDGTCVLGVHASPRSDDGPGIDPHLGDRDLEQLLTGFEADLVVGGHTHEAVDRRVGRIRAVNTGSVSNSKRSDRRSSYALLRADTGGYEVELTTVDYDHAAVLTAIEAVAHPARAYLEQFQLVGE